MEHHMHPTDMIIFTFQDNPTHDLKTPVYLLIFNQKVRRRRSVLQERTRLDFLFTLELPTITITRMFSLYLNYISQILYILFTKGIVPY